MNSVEHIGHYSGFKKVCSVRSTRVGNFWEYTNIDKTLMYSEHRSWVYAITRFGKIVKIGESGLTLGIKMKNGDQPKGTSKCRLGRYRKGDNTDRFIRDLLRADTQNKLHTSAVEIYAFQCPESDHTIKIGDTDIVVKSHIHKDLEKAFLDYFKKHTGRLPIGNPGRC